MAYILEARNLTKYFGSNLLFENLALNLDRNDKAGLIGANGVGKTTLMNSLMNKESLDQGTIRLERFTSIGYLEQIPVYSEDTTLISLVLEVFADIFEQRKRLAELEFMMSHAQDEALEKILRQYGTLREQYERAGGFACEAQTRKVLYGLGFKDEDFERTFTSFSGGEKTRISLARILVREHDILLDEPTNHLDLDAIEWLESYLIAYRGALLIISHDRYFLDQVTNTTFNMDGKSLKRYKGNYSTFMKLKEEEDEAQRHAYEKQHREIEITEAYILRNKAGIKSKQARGRQSHLDRLERIEKVQIGRSLNMGQAAMTTRTGEKVLNFEKVSYHFPDRPLLNDLEQEIVYQERVALLGPNGMGKTTLLRLILGQLQPQQGKIRFGSRVKIAYFDQEHSNLDLEKKVISEVVDNYDLTLEEAKSLLARFMFREDELEKKIKVLSGGEQGRLSLLKLTLEKGNFLILDEPTNHLDISSREAIESYLQSYPGTILMVSHDRYFVDAVADRILELKDGQLTSYIGNYSDYKEKKADIKDQMVKAALDAEALKNKANEQTSTSDNNQSKNRSNERIKKAQLREKVQMLEQEITSLEDRLIIVTEALGDSETYQNAEVDLAQRLTVELQNIQKRLPQAYHEWEDTAAQIEG